jgi:hypothetical protein
MKPRFSKDLISAVQCGDLYESISSWGLEWNTSFVCVSYVVVWIFVVLLGGSVVGGAREREREISECKAKRSKAMM